MYRQETAKMRWPCYREDIQDKLLQLAVADNNCTALQPTQKINYFFYNNNNDDDNNNSSVCFLFNLIYFKNPSVFFGLDNKSFPL
jgi:hypothetical protein